MPRPRPTPSLRLRLDLPFAVLRVQLDPRGAERHRPPRGSRTDHRTRGRPESVRSSAGVLFILVVTGVRATGHGRTGGRSGRVGVRNVGGGREGAGGVCFLFRARKRVPELGRLQHENGARNHAGGTSS